LRSGLLFQGIIHPVQEIKTSKMERVDKTLSCSMACK
jgi:hypothetical protein